MTFERDSTPTVERGGTGAHSLRAASVRTSESLTAGTENLRRLGAIMNSMVQGRQFAPETGSDPALYRAVAAQIKNMVDADLLPDSPDAYCIPARPVKPDPWPRELGYNPAPEILVKGAQDITESLGAKGTSAVNVLGARPNQSVWIKVDTSGAVNVAFDYERDRRAAEAAMAGAALNIAIPGELRAAQQLLRCLQQREDAAGKKFAPLIVENSRRDEPRNGGEGGGGFWSPLLVATGLLDRLGRATPKAEKFGIIITETRDSTIVQGRQILGQVTLNQEKYPPLPALHASGTPINIGSTSKDKFDEVSATVAHGGYHAPVRPLEAIADYLISPVEDRGSYEGNGMKKLLDAVRAYVRTPTQTRQQISRNLGHDATRGSILIEDSGFHTHQGGVFHGTEFNEVRHLVDPQRRCPGVETGPAMWTSGVKVFFRRLGVEVARLAREEGRAPDYGCTNISVVAMTPMEADARGWRPVQMAFAVRRGVFSDAEPSDRTGNNNFRIGDYLYPQGHGGKNETQLGAIWAAQVGTKPGAFQALAAVVGIEAGVNRNVTPAVVTDFKAALVQSVQPPKHAAVRMQKISRSAADIIPTPSLERFADVQRHIFAPYDAVGFKFDAAEYRGDPARAFIKAGTIFFPAVVAKQVRDKFMLNKLLALFDDEHGIAKRFMAMVHDLHKLGGIPQEPRKLIVTPQDIDGFARHVGNARKDYALRYPAYSYAHGEKILVDQGSRSPFDYNVSGYTSAHMKSRYVVDLSEEITEGLCRQGIGVISGGGLNGSMGAITDTVHRLHKAGYDVHHTGITTPHVQFLEGDDKIRQRVQRYVLTDNIHTREELLCGLPNCGIIKWGGSGTLSEMFRKLAIMIGLVKNEAAPHVLPQDQIMVIVNPKIPGRKRGYYDVVIDNMPEEILADPRVHVAKDGAAVLDIVAAHRAELSRSGRLAAQRLRALRR